MAAGLLPSRGMSPGTTHQNGGLPVNHRLKHALPKWEYVSFEEGKWMIGCCGTVEPSIDFSEAKEPDSSLVLAIYTKKSIAMTQKK